MIERTAEGFEVACYMCEHSLKGDTWQEVHGLMAWLDKRRELMELSIEYYKRQIRGEDK